MPQVTTESRRAESKHVLYEIEMFCALARYFETKAVDRAVQTLEREGIVVRNAVIEAFQVHARQLIEFLTYYESKKPHKDDIPAAHFTRTRRWDYARPRELEELRQLVHKRVAHLSVRRAEFTGRERWVATQDMRLKVGQILEAFLDEVDETVVCDGFVARARNALLASAPRPSVVQPPTGFGATESPVRTDGGGGTIVMMPNEPPIEG